MPSETLDRETDVRCDCGERLVDALGPDDIILAGTRYPFRRRTDHLICPSCLLSQRVIDLRDA